MVAKRPLGVDHLNNPKQKLNYQPYGGLADPAGSDGPDLCGHRKVSYHQLNHPNLTIACSIDATTIITGNSDGGLTVFDKKMDTNFTSPVHEGAVTAVDACFGYVVSAGADQALKVCRYSSASLEPVKSAKLPFIAADIKLVKLGELTCVAVVSQKPTELDFLSIEDLTVYKSINLYETGGRDRFICQKISLNLPRTHYAVIGRRGECVRSIVGVVGANRISDVLCVYKGYDSTQHYSFYWGDPDDTFWITNNKGFIRSVKTDSLEITGDFGCHQGVIH